MPGSRCSERLVAEVYLARIPQSERHLALNELASTLQDTNSFTTADIVSHGLDQCVDEKVEFILNEFVLDNLRNGDLQSLADFCCHSERTEKRLVQSIAAQLNEHIELLLSQPKAIHFIVPVGMLRSFVSGVRIESPLDSQLAIDPSITIRNLSFLTILCRTPASFASGLLDCSHPIFNLLISLLFASDLEVVSAARLAVQALVQPLLLVTSTQSDSSAIQAERPAEKLWQGISLLLIHGKHSIHRSAAYQLWLRWMSVEAWLSTISKEMNTDEYWQHVREALTTGDVEQRKSCLHILRRSMTVARDHGFAIETADVMFDPAIQASAVIIAAEFERFCVVYETIVLGRYLNQVQECISDMNALASSKTHISRSWLLALLIPALTSTMIDSIQKVIGNWLLGTDLAPSENHESLSRLISESFLPWAVQGQHFTGTLTSVSQGCRCEHGDRLTTFIRSLLVSHNSADLTKARQGLTRTILTFLTTHRTRVMSYPVVYILQGLMIALETEEKTCLQVIDLSSVLDLSTGSGYPEVSRDVMALQCSAIYRHALLLNSELSTTSRNDAVMSTKASNLDLRVNSLRQTSADYPDVQSQDASLSTSWTSLHDLSQGLKKTRCACLKGPGLVDACITVSNVIESGPQEKIGATVLLEILEAIWYEVEIQDYPKAALRLLPAIFLHSFCLSLCGKDDDYIELLSSFLADFRRLSRGRIYIWTPLMKALRSAILLFPHLAVQAQLDDIVIDVASQPPMMKLEFQLEAAASSLLTSGIPEYGHLTYEYYYGESERIGYAAFFDIINRLHELNPTIAASIFDRMLKPWEEQKIPAPVVNQWKSTEQLQILLILLEQRIPQATEEEAQVYLRKLLRLLAIEPLPRYRFLIEWMIVRIVIHQEHTAHAIVSALSTNDHHSNPKYLASIIKVAVMICCLDRTDERFAIEVTAKCGALSASSKIIIRHEAQWSFPVLWQHCEDKAWSQITENPAMSSLIDYIKSLDRFNAPAAAREFERLDPVKDHTLVNLLSGSYLLLEPQGMPLVGWEDFMSLQKLDKEAARNHSKTYSVCVPLGKPSLNNITTEHRSQPGARDLPNGAPVAAAPVALQTKGTAYLSSDFGKDVASRPTGLIVVGSLVDNPYNLGGLSRVSEIFGAAALYMNSPRSVLSNKDFVSVAVASQNHLPIESLPTADVAAFLAQKKNEGYCVVGIEQTDRSRLLGDAATVIPRKSVLLLGAEREGIPALLLGECDLLVEVPQKGVTRSLNVQTAAATVLFEYTRQHQGGR